MELSVNLLQSLFCSLKAHSIRPLGGASVTPIVAVKKCAAISSTVNTLCLQQRFP